MTGTNNPGVAVPKHGANLIDGLIFGAKWAETTINYSFSTNTTNYGSYPTSQFSPLETPTFISATQGTKNAAQFASEGTTWGNASLDFSVEGFTNLNIVQTAAPSGLSGAHLRYGQTAMSGSNESDYASFPGTGRFKDLAMLGSMTVCTLMSEQARWIGTMPYTRAVTRSV